MPAEIAVPSLASSTSPVTAPPKRRRVPITIVDSDASAEPTNDLLSPISSRLISKPADAEAGPTPKPELASSFKEAKQVREEKKAGRVGGGIFRVSGNDTVFKTRQVHASKDPAHPPAPAPVTAMRSSGSGSTSVSSVPPRTLFEFTRAWDSIPVSDTASRWSLLNVRCPHLLHTYNKILTLMARRRPSLLRPSQPSSVPRSNRHSSRHSSPCSRKLHYPQMLVSSCVS